MTRLQEYFCCSDYVRAIRSDFQEPAPKGGKEQEQIQTVASQITDISARKIHPRFFMLQLYPT